MSKEKDKNWQPLFDAGNYLVATAISVTVGCCQIFVGRRDCGTVASPEAAKRWVEEINKDGSDGGGES